MNNVWEELLQELQPPPPASLCHRNACLCLTRFTPPSRHFHTLPHTLRALALHPVPAS